MDHLQNAVLDGVTSKIQLIRLLEEVYFVYFSAQLLFFFFSLNQKIYSIEWAQLKQPISKEQLAVPTLCLEAGQMPVSNSPRGFVL